MISKTKYYKFKKSLKLQTHTNSEHIKTVFQIVHKNQAIQINLKNHLIDIIDLLILFKFHN